MLVVVAAFDLDIDFAQSLKDKRQVVRSLKDKLRARFDLSVIEAGFQDVHQRARLAVAFLAHDHAYADSTLDKIEAFVEANADAAVGDFTIEKIELE
jgi:uncharacterized protein YlxP (DUF503 family)